MTPEELDAELTRLHNDPAHAARLSELHEIAAGLAERAEARRFQLTHAWVFALVAGDEARSEALSARLKDLGGL